MTEHSDAEAAGSEPERTAADEPNGVRSLSGRSLSGGIARAVEAGVGGEQVSARGLLSAIGGWRGIVESTLPAILFVVLYALTQDARLSALVPGALGVILVVVRLFRREPMVSALSGVLGVGVAVLVTLITGRGVDYFLWGFIVNAAWSLGLLISVVVGWPAIGLIFGLLRGDLRAWRGDLPLRRTATLLTLLWCALFVARLAVQLPLYLDDQVEALGLARVVMGVPLFAIVVIVTWFFMRRHTPSSDDSSLEDR